jgi:phosphoglycerate kinase
MRSVEDIISSQETVFVRVDYNVPLDQNGHITDDARIRRSIPTLSYLLNQGAKLVVASHLGRPKGETIPDLSLGPAAKRLGEILDKKVTLAEDCVGPKVNERVAKMIPGDIVMLENLRFHAQEQKNDDGFAQKLAALCNAYVNDAFAVSHRANASVVAITRHVSQCAVGYLLQKELDFFKQAMTHPERPLAAVVGGAKVSSKLAALQNMIRQVDIVLVGGAMANTFLMASGINMGRSRVESDLVEAAKGIIDTAKDSGIELLLPVDVVVATDLRDDAPVRVVDISKIPADQMALDIGPATVDKYLNVLKAANTIVWNGPLGAFETKPFARGTEEMVSGIAGMDALTIVGGGDTGVAVQNSGYSDDFSYISTGGGAFLALLEGKTLPAVAALQ